MRATLTIGEVAARSGVSEATLRMWERRHGFPRAERTASGHRRYSEQELWLVQRVGAARAAGVPLSAAIERAREAEEDRTPSLFAALRRRRPELEARLLPRRLMLALSHAIEDECLARAEPALLFGCFQRERFYRAEQPRWRELTAGALGAFVFADFARPARPAHGPVEIPIARSHPLAREWALVCESDISAVCLIGRERASSHAGSPAERRCFEALWSVEPEAVRDGARICAQIAAHAMPGALGPVTERLGGEPALPAREQLRLATSITCRLLSDPAMIQPVLDPVSGT
jgi:DNA-binding transcriptional MerR regulator